jgi:nucleoside-diphosphate-sugar epimerase
MEVLDSVALLGAAGAIGHALVPLLEAQGVAVRVVGRDAAKLERNFPHAEARTADLLTGERLDAAVEGIDTIFYLAGTPYTHFEQHPVMTRFALAAAQRAGVKHFVHITNVYAYGTALSRSVPETQPRVPSTRKGRWRLEQEQLIEAAHGAHGLSTTIAHLPDFYGPNADNGLFNVYLSDAVAGKTGTFVGVPNAEREFIYVPDAATVLLALAAHDEAYGERWNIPGTATTARTVVEIAASQLGVAKVRELAEMYYLADSGFVLDGTKLHERIGAFPPTSLEDGIAATIAWMRSHLPAAPAR